MDYYVVGRFKLNDTFYYALQTVNQIAYSIKTQLGIVVYIRIYMQVCCIYMYKHVGYCMHPT